MQRMVLRVLALYLFIFATVISGVQGASLFSEAKSSKVRINQKNKLLVESIRDSSAAIALPSKQVAAYSEQRTLSSESENTLLLLLGLFLLLAFTVAKIKMRSTKGSIEHTKPGVHGN